MEGVRWRNEKRQQLSGQNENMWIKGASAEEEEEEESGESSARIQILPAF